MSLHRRGAGLLLATVMGFVVTTTGCEKLGGLPEFARARPGTVTASTAQSFSWEGPTAISIGQNANNDLSASCSSAIGAGLGCSQPPALVYSDSRWFLGYNDDYLPTVPGTAKTSAFVNMTDLVTGFFGSLLGTSIFIIDDGNGLNPGDNTASARYIRYASFPNGDVIAVFYVEKDTAGLGGAPHNAFTRQVYANIYDATTNSWGVATALSTLDDPTDLASDTTADGTMRAHLCRPAVATAGDGSAMVAWCEGDNTGANAEIRYARYANGAWSAAANLVDPTARQGGHTDDYTFPGYSAIRTSYEDLSDNGATTYIRAGDTFTATINTPTVETATVTAVTNSAGAAQFNIAKDSSNNVLVCSTLQNMVNAVLSATTSGTSTTLSQLGVSAVVDPNCDSYGTTAAGRAWNVTYYYNRGLTRDFKRVNGNDDYDMEAATATLNSVNEITIADNTVGTIEENWKRSAMVDLAGDSYGNYALIRSVLAPYFQTTTNEVDGNGIGLARMLIGHEFIGPNADWRLEDTDGDGTDDSPSPTFVSRAPTCSNGLDTVPCSVRNPKILMSDSGKGLILFHQNQLNSYATGSANDDKEKNPNRLWFATYGTATGFTNAASAVDEDLVCSTSSTANDVSVCTTGSYTNACQSLYEPSGAATIELTPGDIDHDVPPIAAAMNASGQAVVAYHKRGRDSTGTNTCSDYVRLHVRTYDPFNGFGDEETIDDDSGDTLSAAVAITDTGNIAVVWETIDADDLTKRYVYMKTKVNGTWSSQVQVNDATDMGTPGLPMLPSVGFKDSGEIVVTFSEDPTGTRMQYVKHYFYH